MIQSLYTYLDTKYEINSNDIEVVASSLRGILRDPDLVTDENLKLIIDII